MKALFSALMLTLLSSAPAVAGVTVYAPTSNSTVGTPFLLTASASACQSQPITTMGYSLDSGATTTFKATSISTQVSASKGNHTLHVKSWGNHGAACSVSVPILVSTSTTPDQFTDVTVSQPTGALKLVSPFAVVASGTLCNSHPITAMGYSVDTNADTITPGASLNAQVASPTGAHTLHIRSWNDQNASCVKDVAITVVPAPETTLPSSAIASSNIHLRSNWFGDADAGTGATSTTYGSTSLTSAPTISGTSRKFFTTTESHGGVRYHVSFGADSSATNFLYDTWVYIGDGAANISNLEFDMNQVMPDRRTVIYGFQCDTWKKTWDYAGNGTWQHSNAPCNVRNWSPYTWHHVQISYSRDNSGNITYKSVWLDNVEQDLNVTINNARALGWSAGDLLTNYQVDGMTTASSTSSTYLDKLTVYRW